MRFWIPGTSSGTVNFRPDRFALAVPLCFRSDPVLTRSFPSAGNPSTPQLRSRPAKYDSDSGASSVFRSAMMSSKRTISAHGLVQRECANALPQDRVLDENRAVLPFALFERALG
jgi:hypothetical protein